MAATIQINQYWSTNAATKQANISRGDWLSADVAHSSDLRSTYPITKPPSGTEYSFENWHKLEVTAMGGSTEIDTIRYHLTSAVPAGFGIDTSADTTTPSDPSGTTPVDTDSTIATYTMPTADPAQETIAGDITSPGESSYVVDQLDCDNTVTAGFERTVRWTYAEIS